MIYDKTEIFKLFNIKINKNVPSGAVYFLSPPLSSEPTLYCYSKEDSELFLIQLNRAIKLEFGE